jgi:CheY-like chemotaxis protein
MGNRIRVLIADDQAISREGIRRILERENDMEVVGAVQTAPEVLPQVRVKNPDVVLLDLRWHHDDQAMNEVIAQLRQGYPETCIIGLTAYEGLVEQARAAGATWAVTKDVGKDELLHLIRAASEVVGLRELENVRSALNHLRGLKTGHQYAVVYERDVRLILKTVLHPHLTNPRPQARTFGGGFRRDILFSNYSSHPFWRRVSQRHDATLIVFEIKNVRMLYVRYVHQVAGYLTPGLGRLGFLVSRISPRESIIQRAVDVFKTERKVVVFLCDDDLEDMLELKERGGEPTELIRRAYDDFIALT